MARGSLIDFYIQGINYTSASFGNWEESGYNNGFYINDTAWGAHANAYFDLWAGVEDGLDDPNDTYWGRHYQFGPNPDGLDVGNNSNSERLNFGDEWNTRTPISACGGPGRGSGGWIGNIHTTHGTQGGTTLNQANGYRGRNIMMNDQGSWPLLAPVGSANGALYFS